MNKTTKTPQFQYYLMNHPGKPAKDGTKHSDAIYTHSCTSTPLTQDRYFQSHANASETP